ncbi:TetR/AcrR family transcriptional regulator [Phenylobacterium aquaticum]|uniref:TetR/AcrR family transcriptional regulator n=1 Tax=Phenylobacterium aquaticum TaxID=1763816 RepID=UPI0026E9DD1E|nr:TetR family transcriptional regulator [Phenylobacterium aquaticum]
MSDAPTRPRGRPARNDRPVGETREAILAAALDVFSRRGFEGASLRDIAAAAGLEHSLVRYHFTDKAGLWRAAMTHLIALMDAHMLEGWRTARTLPAVDRFAMMVTTYVRYCARHPEHARIMVHETMGDSDRVTWIAEHIIAPQHRNLSRMLETLMDQGHIPRSPVRPLIYILSAAAQAPFTLAGEVRAAYGVDTASEAEITAHTQALLGLVLR